MGQGRGSLFLTKLTNHLDLLYNIKKLLPHTKSDRCQLKITKSSEFDRPSVRPDICHLKITKSSEFDCHLWKDDYEQMQKTE